MFKKHLLLGASLLSAALIATPVAAQQDEIIVTATKRETTLQDTPVAVQVIGAEQIEQAQILDILDLQSVTPSFRVSQLQNTGNSSLIIRGFGNGGNNLGIEPSVGLYIDGVYRSRAASQIADLPNLERVEILKGPQSILFGKNASAGVVSVHTQKPQHDVEGYIEGGVGNFNFFQAKYYLTGGITDNLAVSIGGSFQQRDGTFDNEALNSDNSINDRNRWNINLQALWEPRDDVSFRFIYDRSSILESCCGVATGLAEPIVTGNPDVPLDITSAELVASLGGQVADVNDPFSFDVFFNQETENDIDDVGISLESIYENDLFEVTSVTAYRENSNDFDASDSDFTSLEILGNVAQDVDIETFTQEVRIASTGDDNFVDWLVGGFYFNETLEQDSLATFGADSRAFVDALATAAGDGFNILPFAEGQLGLDAGTTFFGDGQGSFETFVQDNENWSIFGTVDIHLTDKFTLTGGLNYTVDNKDVTATVDVTDVFGNLELEGADGAAILPPLVFQAIVDGVLEDGVPAGTPGVPPTGIPSFETAFGLPFTPENVAIIEASPGADALAAIQGGAAAIATALTPSTTADVLLAGASADDPDDLNSPISALFAFQFFPEFVNFPNAVESGETRDDDLSFTVRGAYEVNDNFNVYASYATGFKASSFNLTRNSQPFFSDALAIQAAGLAGATQVIRTADGVNNDVVFTGAPGQEPDAEISRGFGTRFAGPEETRVIELGLKARFEKGAFNIAAFDQTIDGFQSTLFQGTAFVLANAGEQSVRGIEFDGTYSPIEPLTLRAGVTYLDAEFDEFVGAPVLIGSDLDIATGQPDDGVGDLSGLRPAGIPEFALSLGANYAHDFGNGIKGFIQGDYQFESEVQVVDNIEGLDRQVSQFNASIGINVHEHFDFRIWGRNLSDDTFFTSAFPAPVQFGQANAYPNQPRTFGGTARFSFF